MSGRDLFDTIAHYLRTELFPNGDVLSQRVLLGLYRHIAQGAPVSLEALGDSLGADGEAVKQVIAAVAPSRLQYDGAGRIVAFAGLSQAPTHHSFVFGARELFTWCAFDALFLPELLGASARVTSQCPVTGADIRVTVTRDGPEEVMPSDTAMSFVTPSAETCCTDLRGVFCDRVNFLSAPEAGAEWLARNPDAAILSLEDAFALGRIRNRSAFGGVLAGGAGRAAPRAIETTATRGAP